MHSIVEPSDRIAPSSSLVSWRGSSMDASGRGRPGMSGMPGMPIGTGLAGLPARLQWWWSALPETARLAALAGLATIAILLLLLAFFSEVREAGRQGGMRREATAALTALTWRCNAMPDAGARQDCLSRLPPVPSRGVLRTATTDSAVVGATLVSDARKAP